MPGLADDGVGIEGVGVDAGGGTDAGFDKLDWGLDKDNRNKWFQLQTNEINLQFSYLVIPSPLAPPP